MKKILVLISAFVVFAFSAAAQDTVQYGDPYYLFNERHPYTVFPYPQFATLGTWNNLCSFRTSAGNNQSSRYMAPYLDRDEPILVYGVALTIEGMNRHELEVTEMDKYPYEVIVAKIVNDTFVVIGSTRWDSRKDAHAKFKYSMIGDGVLYENIEPVYEFYFDTPLLVYDTFYVGYRMTVPEADAGGHLFVSIYSVDSKTSYWVHTDNVQNHWSEWRWGGVFPIIYPNRHCAVPESPRPFVNTITNEVRFELPYSVGDSMVLSIAPFGQPADSGTFYPVTSDEMSLVIPNSGLYSSWLYRICQRFDIITLQSDWSDPAHFAISNSLCVMQPTDNIEDQLLVNPNPATDEVSIDSPVPLTLVEAYDEKGACILHQELNTQHSSLNTKTWSSGAYILRIHTPQGVAIKKLAVRH